MATTADYLNNLIAQRNALADNLVSKGVKATHDELLDTLVPKVLDINSGGESLGGVEILERAYCTGGCLIDYIPSNLDIIEVIFDIDQYNSLEAIIGQKANNETNGNRGFHITMYQNHYNVGTGNLTNHTEVAFEGDYVGKHTIKINRHTGDIILDGEMKATGTNFVENEFPLIIGNRWYEANNTCRYYGYIYNVKIYDAVTQAIKYNFVPAKIYGQLCIFDTITERMYYTSNMEIRE